MQIYFKTRDQARKASFGKLVDNGATAQHGKRYARTVNAHATANKAGSMSFSSIAECPITGRCVPVFVRGKNKL